MGRRPLIQRDAVVRTAIEIVDAEGPGALSVEKIASRMGVRGPSLYNHFADKAEILAETARAIILDTPRLPDPVDPGEGRWKDWLIESSVRFRATLLAHSRAVPLVVEYFPRALLETLYAQHCKVLDAGGVPIDRQMFVLESVHRMTVGSAMCVATGRPAMAPFLEPARFDPRLNDALESGGWSDERLFVEMLRVFLDNVG
ncbi:TetR/AcrR family transcriptional regulator [Rhodococcus sp. NPDC003348]